MTEKMCDTYIHRKPKRYNYKSMTRAKAKGTYCVGSWDSHDLCKTCRDFDASKEADFDRDNLLKLFGDSYNL